MQKLMKNWIFTLVIAVILLCFGVIMFTPLGEDAMSILVAVGAVIYMVLVLADNVIHYDGKLRIFAVIELLLVAVLVVGLVVEDYRLIPLDGVSGSVGAIMWLRAFVEVLHGYYLQENVGRAKAEAPVGGAVELGKVEHFKLGRMLICIAVLSVGVALICADSSEIEEYIRFSIAIISVLLGAAMAFVTYKNRAAIRNSYREAVAETEDPVVGAENVATETEAPAADAKERAAETVSVADADVSDGAGETAPQASAQKEDEVKVEGASHEHFDGEVASCDFTAPRNEIAEDATELDASKDRPGDTRDEAERVPALENEPEMTAEPETAAEVECVDPAASAEGDASNEQ